MNACYFCVLILNWAAFANLLDLGVLSWKLDADNYETDPELKKIREARGYSYTVCESSEWWDNWSQKYLLFDNVSLENA